MRRILLYLLVGFFGIQLSAQAQRAKTDGGDLIILKGDKTWEYVAVPVDNLLPTQVSGDIIIKKCGFTIDFNENNRILDWAAYMLTKYQVQNATGER